MRRRLHAYPEIAAHDVVTRAMRAAGTDEFGGTVWIPPLEHLVRALDREARLVRAPRRRVRAELVELLAQRAGPVPTGFDGGRPLVVVTGADAVALATLESHLRGRDPAHPSSQQRFASAFASIGFEERWHVPSYAEWLADEPLEDVIGDVIAHAAVAPGDVVAVGAVEAAERLDTLLRLAPDAVVVDVTAPEDVVSAEVARRSVAARRADDPGADPARVERYWTWRVAEIARRRGAIDVAPAATITRDQVLADPSAAATEILSRLSRRRS